MILMNTAGERSRARRSIETMFPIRTSSCFHNRRPAPRPERLHPIWRKRTHQRTPGAEDRRPYLSFMRRDPLAALQLGSSSRRNSRQPDARPPVGTKVCRFHPGCDIASVSRTGRESATSSGGITGAALRALPGRRFPGTRQPPGRLCRAYANSHDVPNGSRTSIRNCRRVRHPTSPARGPGCRRRQAKRARPAMKPQKTS